MTRASLRKCIQRSELTATILRQPGFTRLGLTERQRIADDLVTLAALARRYFDTETLDITPLLPDQSSDDDATESDLFGGAA